MVQERLRFPLDALPIGPALKLSDRLLALGDAARRDTELVELLDLLVEPVLLDLGRLPLPLERFRLFLEDSREAGGRKCADPTRSRRTSPS